MTRTTEKLCTSVCPSLVYWVQSVEICLPALTQGKVSITLRSLELASIKPMIPRWKRYERNSDGSAERKNGEIFLLLCLIKYLTIDGRLKLWDGPQNADQEWVLGNKALKVISLVRINVPLLTSIRFRTLPRSRFE